ncbi:MAG: hypothetical protein NC113_09630 [Bacteroides sp.]|nr:hypothetical protein [Bacteroides sp.]MCM1448454.1 hypothetical protein [Bacteroides sp.]
MNTLYKSILMSVVSSLTILFAGCGNDTKQAITYDGEKLIEMDSISLQRVDLEETTTTYEIESGIKDTSIYVMDKYLCTLNLYNTKGEWQSSHLGAGHAYNETVIGRIAGCSFLPDGRLAIFNTSAVYMLYNDNLCMQDWFRIDYNESLPKNCYEKPQAYTQRYNRLVCRSYGDCIYCNMELATQETNMLVSGSDFLENASNIMEIDMEKKILGRLFAKGFPDSYSDTPLSKIILSSSYFDIDANGNFYVTFEADSAIYVYDKNNHGLARFGFAGKNMETNYTSTPTLADVRKNYSKERKRCGYYNWIEYDDANGLLFRSYQKGEHEAMDGLQIYRNHNLIADIDVPKNFKVMGYIEPYYYSQVIADEDNEKLYLYRFALCE